MKRGIVIGLIALAFNLPVVAQLTGIKNIPGDFPTLAAAISALNASGAGAGGVIFRVSAGHAETFSSSTSGNITTLTGSLSSPITFTRWGTGSNPNITSFSGKGDMDAIITVAGCDYVTFDGIDLTDNAANSTPEESMEWGYAILKHSGTNGSQNITIKNCTVSLHPEHTSSAGIYSGNHTFASLVQLTVTDISGTNSRLKIYGNQVNNCYSGICLYGFSDQTAPYSFYDQDNEIGKDGQNTVTNVAGQDVVPGYGTRCSCQNTLTVANNNISSLMGGTGTPYGIYLTDGTNSSYNLYGNSVSIQFWGEGTTSFYPVYCDMGANGTSNVVNVYSNMVNGCTFPLATTGYSYMMYLNNLGVTTNIYGNMISGNTIGATDVESTGRIYYLYCNKNTLVLGPMEVHDNVVTGNAREQVTPLGGYTYFIAALGKGTLLNLYGNTVSGNVVSSSSGTYLINCSFDIGERNIYNNTVSGITHAEGLVYGIYNYNVTSGSGNARIFRNSISNIEGVTAGSNIIGIYSTAPPSSTYIFNNMISDLRATAASYSSVSVTGINQNQGMVSAMNNTVYLNNTSTGTNFSSTAFFSGNGSYATDLRNNIFVNTSTPNGTGKSTVLRFANGSIANLSQQSNYNLLYAGSPSASRLIFFDGTNADQTLSSYQARAYPREIQSVTEMPPFENQSAGSVNVHLRTTMATQCEAGGSMISTPVAVQEDFDGEPRFPFPGYPHGAFIPQSADIGADEFGGIPNDLSPPSIQVTPLQNASNGDARTLVAVLRDGSGIPLTGAGLPMLYWNVNSGPYNGVQGVHMSGSSFSFSFGGGLSIGDVVKYFIVAQDISPAANVIASPSQGAGSYGSFPPSCAVPPATPYSYSIMQGISGVFHVGTGKDYNRLTDAAADLNNKVLSGPVTFILDDAFYPSEIYPVTFLANPGSSEVNTVTIRPATGITPLFYTSSPNGLLDLKGIDYLTLEGSGIGSTGRDLTFENNSVLLSSYAISFINNGGNDPVTHVNIMNCTVKCRPVHASVGNTAIQCMGTGGGHSHIVIGNNAVNSAFDGIQFSGVPADPCHNISIINNIIGSVSDQEAITRTGVNLAFCDSTLVENNDIMGPKSGSLNVGQSGVYMGTGSTRTMVRKNRIHDFCRTADDGWGVSGIWFAAESTSVTEISNNQIYDIKSPGMNPGVGQNITYGIFVRSGGNLKILHNSINLTGSWLSSTYDASSACIGFYYQVTGGNIDIRNNIFRNGMQCQGTPSNYGRAYGIMISGSPSMFTNLNHNDYFIDGINGTIAQQYISGIGTITNFPTLSSWQAFTGQEQASATIDPDFLSDVMLLPTSVPLNNLGEFLNMVPTDFTGSNRNNPPDMGAYEFGADPLVVTNPATSVGSSGAVLHGTVNPGGNTVTTIFDFGPTEAYGNTIVADPPLLSGTNPSPISATLQGLPASTLFHFRARTITAGGLVSFGSDMTFTTLVQIPENITVSGTALNGSDSCYNATGTITVAGNGSTFDVMNGGSATFIAGQKILFLPGTTVHSGGYLLGRITTNGVYCQAPQMAAVIAATVSPYSIETKAEYPSHLPGTGEKLNIRIFPNPVSDVMTVEIPGTHQGRHVTILIQDMTGSRVAEFAMNGETRHEISVSGLKPAMYFLRAVNGETIKVLKFIKL